MEQHQNVLKRFLPTLERYEHVVQDSSGITTYKACPRWYFYQYVLARVPKGQQPAYLQFGTGYHKFRELLSLSYIQWTNAGIQNNISNFPDSYLLAAIKGGLAEYDKGGGEPATGTRFDFLTKARLFEACKVAYKHWVDEKTKGQIEVIAVEVPVNFEYANGCRKNGRMDELILWNKGLWVRDFKCSSKDPKYYPKSLAIKDQAYTYILGASKLTTIDRKVKGIIYEQMYNDKPLKKGDNGKKGPSIHSHIVQFTDSQLENWEYEQVIVHEQINRSRELDIYPMAENDMRCGWCPYYDVCNALNQNQQTGLLLNNYKIHIWNNMVHSDD